MPVATTDLQSKICRAVKALLIAAGAGSAVDTIAAPSAQERSLPVTTILAGDGTPFDGPGNSKHPVTLELRDDAIDQPTETNPGTKRVTASERLTAIWNALNRSDDGHTLYYTAQLLTAAGRALAVDETGGADATVAQRARDNADMADFTVLWWESLGAGSANRVSPEGGVTHWQRDLQFNCVACNSAIS